jgi:hypothetical protein
MEAARTNVGSHYQWRPLVPMEAARTNGAACTNGGGPYQWRRPLLMEAAITNGGGPY